MRCCLPVVFALALTAIFAARAQPVPLFPFVLPWDDASPGPTDLSGWNAAPAGKGGFVTVRNGHLSAGGQRLRFFGTNLTFRSCFPEHADAEKVAARMAKFGINAVRFHHMDTSDSPDGLLLSDKRSIDPKQLDRLDYLVAQLKRRGIYSDINLHVGRVYPGMPTWEGMPGYFKGVDNFYPPMIAMQKEYARALLNHTNPYTKTRYAVEPAVAIVEINNENGLIGEWNNGSLDRMPAVYTAELKRQWNAWLSRKYRTDAALRKAWNAKTEPLGAELLRNPGFTSGADGWFLEQHEDGKASLDISPTGPGGAPAASITVSKPGAQAWYVQFNQGGLPLARERAYTVAFTVKADPPRPITLSIGQAHEPWRNLWSNTVDAAGDWKTFRLTFLAPDGDDNARITFADLGRQAGTVSFSGFSLKPGGTTGLPAGQRLGGVDIIRHGSAENATPPASRDWFAFLWDTERTYWTGMARFLKDDLKVKALIVGTACGFSPAPIQASLDAVDSHAYWQHPAFPNRPWDADDWTVGNIPMAGAKDGGTLPGLARYRVVGKPFLVTEYNHPAPNTYSSEGLLLLAAYGALQDWDGLFQFDYGGVHGGDDAGRIGGFFTLDQHPTKMATLPTAAALFRRADVSSPGKQSIVSVSTEMALDAVRRSGPWSGVDAFGIPALRALECPISMRLVPRADTMAGAPDPKSPIRSYNAELMWDSRPEAGVVTIDTARTKGGVGYLRGRSFDLGGISIVPGATRQDWATITLTSLDGRGLGAPGRVLVTATGYTENTDMGWKDATHTSVGSRWGRAPSLVEGIPASITFPFAANRVRAWALDGKGQRAGEVPITASGDKTLIEIGPSHKTLWYEVEIR